MHTRCDCSCLQGSPRTPLDEDACLRTDGGWGRTADWAGLTAHHPYWYSRNAPIPQCGLADINADVRPRPFRITPRCTVQSLSCTKRRLLDQLPSNQRTGSGVCRHPQQSDPRPPAVRSTGSDLRRSRERDPFLPPVQVLAAWPQRRLRHTWCARIWRRATWPASVKTRRPVPASDGRSCGRRGSGPRPPKARPRTQQSAGSASSRPSRSLPPVRGRAKRIPSESPRIQPR